MFIENCNVIAFDPGIAKLGWSVGKVKDGTIEVKAGVLRSSPIEKEGAWESYVRRTKELYHEVNRLFVKHNPKLVVMEQFNFYNKFTNAVVPVSLVMGMVLSIAASRHVPVILYNSIRLKKNICGNHKATKKEVREKVNEFIDEKSFDACDAVALLYTWNKLEGKHEFKGAEKCEV